MNNMKELIEKVESWFEEHLPETTPLTKAKQALCVIEEVDEFISDNSFEELGDVQVTLIGLSRMFGAVPYELYLQSAIKPLDRTGIYDMDKELYRGAAKLGQAVCKSRKEDVLDGIITMWDILHHLQHDLPLALSTAYKKISSRSVKKVDGRLVKDEDLS